MPAPNFTRRAVAALPTALASLLAALGTVAAWAPPSYGWSTPKGTEYSLTVVEGETTEPEIFSPAMTDASVQPSAQVVVSIIHNNILVARQTDSNGNAYLDQVPQPGDVVTLESPAGTLVASVVYDGLPSLDPKVCAGSINFSGQRSADDPVEGGYYSLVSHTNPYGETSWRRTGWGQAQVTSLSGATFAGNFLAPLSIGQTVWASEAYTTKLAGEATFTYSSETQRPVGACPVPPPPPPPPAPAPAPALQGSLLKLVAPSIRALMHSGLMDQVAINQPGTVVEDLYARGGRLPAYASRHRHGKHHPKPLLLARGSGTAGAPGSLWVRLRLTPQGRRALRHARSVHAVLITTLHSSSGATLNLPRRTLWLHR